MNRILQKVDSFLHHVITIKVDDDLQLRLLQMEDADQLFDMTDSNRPYLREWLPWVDSNQSVQDSRRFIQNILDQYRANEGFQCGVWFKGQLAGVVGFHKVDWMNKNVEIGYWLAETYQGKGLMTRSCKALVDYAFNEFKLKRVQIRCATGNIKSCAIPERLGFRKEGLTLQAEYLYGTFVDLVVYGMTDTEWTKIDSQNLPKQLVLSSADPQDVETIDAIIRSMYECITFSPPGLPNFDRLRTLCHMNARFVPPHNSRNESISVFHTEEFIARSRSYIEETEFKHKGFHEQEISRRTEVFGNIAHILSAYESRHRKTDPSPISRGLNSVQLIKDNGRWWILNVAWDAESPRNPIPPDLLS